MTSDMHVFNHSRFSKYIEFFLFKCNATIGLCIQSYLHLEADGEISECERVIEIIKGFLIQYERHVNLFKMGFVR